MDDREEHRGWHSSAGGIYRLSRTVSTCLCHLPKCVQVCTFVLVHMDIFPPSLEMSGRHGYAQMFCLQAFIIQPYVEQFVFCLCSALMIYDMYTLARFVAACYSSRTQVCSRKHGAVRGFLIDFCCSSVDNIFSIILYNIIDHGEMWGLDNAEGELFELESPFRSQFSRHFSHTI